MLACYRKTQGKCYFCAAPASSSARMDKWARLFHPCGQCWEEREQRRNLSWCLQHQHPRLWGATQGLQPHSMGLEGADSTQPSPATDHPLQLQRRAVAKIKSIFWLKMKARAFRAQILLHLLSSLLMLREWWGKAESHYLSSSFPILGVICPFCSLPEFLGALNHLSFLK